MWNKTGRNVGKKRGGEAKVGEVGGKM